MKPNRTLNRRSFLARVGGASAFALAGCTTSGTIDEDPYAPPGAPRGSERPDSQTCTDGDSGSRSDPPGNGRHCRFGETRRRPRRH
jgi:hypothetical protein